MGKRELRAYFVAPLYAKVNYQGAYKKISDLLKNKGYKVYDDVNHISHQQAHAFDDNKIAKYFTKIEQEIRNSDIMVVELSETSASIGFEIGYAIAHFKPVLVLRSDEKKDKLGAPFRANKKLVTVLSYNEKNLGKQIDKFIRKANKGIFVKRTAVEFTANQVEYIEMRQKKGIKKSFNAALREIVDDTLSADRNFSQKNE